MKRALRRLTRCSRQMRALRKAGGVDGGCAAVRAALSGLSAKSVRLNRAFYECRIDEAAAIYAYREPVKAPSTA